MTLSVASTSTTTTATSATPTVNVPSGVAAGEGVLVVIHTNNAQTINVGATGFVHAPGSPLASTGVQFSLNVLFKVASGNDTGTYAFTTAGSDFWAGAASRITGGPSATWDTNSGTGTAKVTSASANSLNTSMTTQAANELLVGAGDQFNGGTWTFTGVTKVTDVDAANKVAGYGALLKAVAGATGTITNATAGGASQMVAWLGALVPADAAVAVPTNNPVRRRVQAPRRRPKATAVVPAQVIVPPFRAVQVKESRTIRGRLYRRGHTVTPVPAQVVTPPPAYAPRPVRVRLRAALVKRMRNDMPPVDQSPAPVPQPPRRRGSIVRRGRTVQVVPAQVTQINPPYPPVNLRVRVRGALSRRGRAVTPVPAQVTPPVVTWTPAPVRVRLRAALVRRGRVVTPPATDARVPLFARIRARLVPPRRGRTRTPVPPQVVVAPPAYPPQPVHRTRRGLRRRTHNVEGWMVGSAQQNCDTPRPFTGITARPGSGTTAYSTATTARPGSGTTTRPDSGETDPPCG